MVMISASKDTLNTPYPSRIADAIHESGKMSVATPLCLPPCSCREHSNELGERNGLDSEPRGPGRAVSLSKTLTSQSTEQSNVSLFFVFRFFDIQVQVK